MLATIFDESEILWFDSVGHICNLPVERIFQFNTFCGVNLHNYVVRVINDWNSLPPDNVLTINVGY